MRFLLLFIALTIFGTGCDRSTPSEEAAPEKPYVAPGDDESDKASDGRAFGFEEFMISPGQQAMLTGAPPPEEVERRLKEALVETPYFSEDGAPKFRAELMYEVREHEEPQGWDAVIHGQFTEVRARDMPRRMMASTEVTDPPTVSSSASDAIDKALAEVVERVTGHALVHQARDEEIAELILRFGETGTLAAQRARDRKLADAIPALRDCMKAAPSFQKVSCASALVTLGDEESYGRIVEVAGNLSRDRDRQFVPMLSVVGDVPTSEAEIYLTTVAEGHSEPAIQQIAQNILARRAQR